MLYLSHLIILYIKKTYGWKKCYINGKPSQGFFYLFIYIFSFTGSLIIIFIRLFASYLTVTVWFCKINSQ
jgi:hypothetical protein